MEVWKYGGMEVWRLLCSCVSVSQRIERRRLFGARFQKDPESPILGRGELPAASKRLPGALAQHYTWQHAKRTEPLNG